MRQTRWKNPYIDRVDEVSEWIPVNSSTQPDELSANRVQHLVGASPKVFCELGSGSGMHLLGQARRMPESVFIGVELRFKRAYRTIEKARKEGLENVYVLRTHARFLEGLIPAGSLSGIFMNFPDPWDRKKWKKHRMFSANFLDLAAKLLKPDGFISFKTDHAEYFSVVEHLVRSSDQFDLTAYSTDLAHSEFEKENISSEFEQLFRSKQQPIHYLSAKKFHAPREQTVY